MFAIGWLILAPVIPAISIFSYEVASLEGYIPWAKLPKALLGAYALHLFVAFHFHDNHQYWWLYYGWLVVVGLVLSIMGVVEKVQQKIERRGEQ